MTIVVDIRGKKLIKELEINHASCNCGCGEEVRKGNKWVNGHNGRVFSKEIREKIGKANKGRIPSVETRKKLSEAQKGKTHSEETKRKISESNKGSKNPSFKHGKDFLYNQHKQYKKQECIFGCENAKKYNIHHEPPIKNILAWEGRLINLCASCHKRVHDRTLKLPDTVGVLWTKKDTKELMQEKF